MTIPFILGASFLHILSSQCAAQQQQQEPDIERNHVDSNIAPLLFPDDIVPSIDPPVEPFSGGVGTGVQAAAATADDPWWQRVWSLIGHPPVFTNKAALNWLWHQADAIYSGTVSVLVSSAAADISAESPLKTRQKTTLEESTSKEWSQLWQERQRVASQRSTSGVQIDQDSGEGQQQQQQQQEEEEEEEEEEVEEHDTSAMTKLWPLLTLLRWFLCTYLCGMFVGITFAMVVDEENVGLGLCLLSLFCVASLIWSSMPHPFVWGWSKWDVISTVIVGIFYSPVAAANKKKQYE